MNRSGAIKTADYIGEFIDNNYDLLDIRKIESNLWEGKIENIIGKRKIEWEENIINVE